MRVLLVVHCFFPDHFYGTETYTLELARNLKILGHEPIVLSAVFPGEPRQQQLISHYDFDGIPVYSIDKNQHPHTRVKDTYYQPSIREVHAEFLRSIQPDVVHVTHLINHTGVFLEAAHALGLPIVATFTDFFGFCFNNKLEASDGSLCTGPNTRRTNCLACYNKALSEQPGVSATTRLAGRPGIATMSANAMELVSRLPGFRSGPLAGRVLDITQRPATLAACYQHYRAAIVPTRLLKSAYMRNGFTLPMHEIRFGVDLPRVSKVQMGESDPVRLGFIGQIAQHKGVDLLVDAFNQLPERSVELHIYGSDSQYPDYATELKTRAAGKAVFFRGTFPSKDMAAVLADLDFLVIPSRWFENSPLVLLYALASHTPVIVADVDGLTEFVEAGVNGWIFERDNVASLTQVLKTVVSNPAAARQLSESTDYPRTTATMTADVIAVYDAAR